MRKKTQPPVHIELPPAEFSNAMNRLHKDWNFQGWETSPEWKLFQAGREAALNEIARGAKQEAEYAATLSRMGGRKP